MKVKLDRVAERPNPNSPDHIVITFLTKVKHEIAVMRMDKDKYSDIMIKYLRGYTVEYYLIKEMVNGYEDFYPETADQTIFKESIMEA